MSRAGVKRPRADVRVLGWNTMGALMKAWVVKDRKLAVYATENGPQWIVVAVETDADTVEAIFDSHAHAIVGRFDELAEALTAANDYGAKWLAEGVKLPKCECEDITSIDPVDHDHSGSQSP